MFCSAIRQPSGVLRRPGLIGDRVHMLHIGHPSFRSQACAHSGDAWPELAVHWSDAVRRCFGPASFDLPGFTRCGPNLVRVRPDVGRHGPTSANIGPDSAPHVCRFWHGLDRNGHIWPARPNRSGATLRTSTRGLTMSTLSRGRTLARFRPNLLCGREPPHSDSLRTATRGARGTKKVSRATRGISPTTESGVACSWRPPRHDGAIVRAGLSKKQSGTTSFGESEVGDLRTRRMLAIGSGPGLTICSATDGVVERIVNRGFASRSLFLAALWDGLVRRIVEATC